MKRKATLTALTLAAVMVAGVSTAINAQGMGGRSGGPGGFGMGPKIDFAAIDANGDGKITPDEMKAWQAKQVDGLDANNDGYLTEDEIVNFRTKQAEARIKARVAAMFAKRDLNGDGKLSAAEMMSAPRDMIAQRMFRMADRNKDGAVSQAEFDAAKARVMQRMDRFQDGRGKRWHHGQRGDRDGWMMRGQAMQGQAMRGQGQWGTGNCQYPGARQGMGPGQGMGQGMGQGLGQGRMTPPPAAQDGN